MTNPLGVELNEHFTREIARRDLELAKAQEELRRIKPVYEAACEWRAAQQQEFNLTGARVVRKANIKLIEAVDNAQREKPDGI